MRDWNPDAVWQQFLLFCGDRVPTDELAELFSNTTANHEPGSHRDLIAAALLVTLRAKLLLK